MRQKFFLRDLAATDHLARAFAEAIEGQAFFALNGPLGVGKTRFVKALTLALGVEEIVNSPTFTMLNEYHSGRFPVYHLDLYRLLDSQPHSGGLEFLQAELSEVMQGDCLVLVEWAELLKHADLSEGSFIDELDYLTADFSYEEVINENRHAQNDSLYTNEPGRLVDVQAAGANSRAILKRVCKDVPELVC